MKIIEFTDERKAVEDFLELSKKLYDKRHNMEDSGNVKRFLLGKHILSKYFTLHKFLVYDEEEAVGRFAITTYEDDENCYFGFFECINDKQVAKIIFDKAKEFQKKNGYKQIVGPVDGSFWNKYRLKTNMFEQDPYTGEPYNKEYYHAMFLENGFVDSIKYVSNGYKVVGRSYDNLLFENNFAKMTNLGCKIVAPRVADYEKIIDELYDLLTKLYSSFPIYKPIDRDDFVALFMSYKVILNMDMVRMAYYDGKLVGFFISVPDYGNRVYHLNSVKNLVEIFKLKKHPKQYILLYVGADPKYRGLGTAMSCQIMEELRKNKLPSIGALIMEGKVTQKYDDSMVDRVFEYTLMTNRKSRKDQN